MFLSHLGIDLIYLTVIEYLIFGQKEFHLLERELLQQMPKFALMSRKMSECLEHVGIHFMPMEFQTEKKT